MEIRLTAAKAEEISSSRSSKVPKIETLALHHLLDEPPSIEISNATMGMHAVRVQFETWAFAIAMCEVCHLASLKEYYIRFLEFLGKRYDQDSGLRPPSILEAQSADKALMQLAFDLMQEKQWGADDAFHEVTWIRAEMASLLQPRPRISSRAGPPSGGKGSDNPTRFQASSKGKGSGPSKGKGKPTKGGPGRVQWMTEIIDKSGEKRQLCMRFQTGKCTLGSQCRFFHGCGYPVNGAPCGKNHGAAVHESAPH